MFPPVNPSRTLAKKSTARGSVTIKTPKILESALKRFITGRKSIPRKITEPGSTYKIEKRIGRRETFSLVRGAGLFFCLLFSFSTFLLGLFLEIFSPDLQVTSFHERCTKLSDNGYFLWIGCSLILRISAQARFLHCGHFTYFLLPPLGLSKSSSIETSKTSPHLGQR